MIEVQTSFETRPHRAPVPVRGATLFENRFLKVELLGQTFYVSVLPHFHEASLEEINFKILHFFKHYELDFKDINFSLKFFNIVRSEDAFLESIKDETLFNIEAILLGVLRSTHPHLFTHDAVAINHLYNKQSGAEFYIDTDCIKIKITPKSALETVNVINELSKLNDKMIYRLDGNRRFELGEMIEFTQVLQDHLSAQTFSRIDYIEEPFKNFYDTFLFQKRSMLTVAIDESYKNYMGLNRLNFPAVIKPSLIGISPVVSWLGFHEDNRAIISSSYEHPSVLVGLEFLARLRPNEFHGLENFHLKT